MSESLIIYVIRNVAIETSKKERWKKTRCLEYFPRSNLYIFSEEAIEDSRVYLLKSGFNLYFEIRFIYYELIGLACNIYFSTIYSSNACFSTGKRINVSSSDNKSVS